MPGPAEISAESGESHRPEMLDLALAFYPEIERLGRIVAVTAGEMPPASQSLLAHDDHMTVTLEAHHESLVKVNVLEERREAGSYARKSVLARQSDGRPVQLGIMRIALSGLPEQVRDQIESQTTPLGRILIRNNLLREVELLALWRVEPAEDLRGLLQLEPDEVVYGRSARILVDGKPVVELLEIARL